MQRPACALVYLLLALHALPVLGVRAQETMAGATPAEQPAGGTPLALFPTASQDPKGKNLGAALDPVLLTQLEKVAGITVAARPALDLPALEIALDCVGETPECLRAVTQQSNVQRVIAPAIQITPAETVVTLLYFDSAGEGELRSATRRHSGPEPQRSVLDAVPDMIRELLRIPPNDANAAPAWVAPDTSEDVQIDEPPRPFPWAPVIVTAAGVVVIGVSAGLGVAANATQDRYARAPANNRDQVDDAIETLSTARQQALIANIGYGVGAAALITAGVLWVLELSDEPGESDEHARVRVAPSIGPSTLGVVVHAPFTLSP